MLYRLVKSGYDAYLVGGSVRDLLLGLQPKDFDIATEARPEEVKALFRNCRLIGRRFRLAHVRFGREVVEVATFRAAHEEADALERTSPDGRLLSDNVYGTREEDAARRDFTINALYYDVRDFTVLDFAGGMTDLRERVVRLIGDPETRYREDPVRILRAIRFAAKLGFELHAATEAPIWELSRLLRDIPAARLFDEVLKLLMTGHAAASIATLERFDVLGYLFPGTVRALARADSDQPRRFVEQAMRNTDARLAVEKPVTPGFLFAALLWPAVVERAAHLRSADVDEPLAREQAAGEVIAEQVQHVAVPRRFSTMAREIWSLQPRLERRRRRDALGLLENPRFRAAYDFLLLRAESGEDVGELAEWWTAFQSDDPEARARAVETLPARHSRRRRGPRRRRRPDVA